MRKDLIHPTDDPRVRATKEAIRKAGGLTKTSRVIGITPQGIYKWELVPAKHCHEMQRLSGVSIHELRPDVFGVKPGRGLGNRDSKHVSPPA